MYDEAKVYELENAEELSGKEAKKLMDMQKNKPLFDAILDALTKNVSEKKYLSLSRFYPVLESCFRGMSIDKKVIDRIAYGLSEMDKEAEIQRDKKGKVIYDKETKDVELVKFEESIEDYMNREVLPRIPDAVAFFEEDLAAKKPVIKTGAEIPFTRYFYKYQQPEPSEKLKERFMTLESSVNEEISNLFSEGC